MRTRASVDRALAMGIARVVIGTRAAESEAFISELVAAHGDRIAVGIDAKAGKVAVKGWVDTTATTALGLARRMDALGVATLIHTDVGTDGMLTGPNFAAQEAMLECRAGEGDRKRRVWAPRGRGPPGAARQPIPNLDGVIVGKALYEGRVLLRDLLAVSGEKPA
jgi:phosphoribosylformimino-5-aminoimidazole carboxamide ribotide isomerase